MLQFLNSKRTDDRNALYLVVEVFWATILGSAATFNAAFAIRLGANNFEVGLLSSLPALLAMLVSVPAGAFFQTKSNRKVWVFGSLAIHRSGFLLVALAPFLTFLGVNPGLLVVCILIIIGIPAHFFNVGWIPMLAEVVPEDRRAAVFSARNIVSGATTSLFNFLFGQWLTYMAFPGNYQIMYVFAWAMAMLSQFNLAKVKVPLSISTPRSTEKQSLRQRWNGFIGDLKAQPGFTRITLNTLLHAFGLWMAGPLYILYYVRNLHASDAWIGLLGTVTSLAAIAGYAIWRNIIHRWKEPAVLKKAIFTAGIYPILAGSFPALTPILFAAGLNGLLTPGLGLSHFNTLLKVIPEASRPKYTALYVTITNLGATLCPLLGVAIASQIGLAPTLIGCGILSLLGSCSFTLWPVTTSAEAN